MKKFFYLAFIVFFISSCSGGKNESKSSSSSDKTEEVKAEQKDVAQAIELTGAINDQYNIVMKLDAKGELVEGSYYYTSSKAYGELKLQGKLEKDGHLVLNEFNSNGRPTGHFDGYYGKSAGYLGTFTNFRNESFPFSLSTREIRDLAGDGEGRGFLAELPDNSPIASVGNQRNDKYSTEEDSYTDSGSNNWEELLDSYEKYANEYIKFAKKASKGDVSALSEYSNCLQKAYDLADKLQNAQNDLTSSQIARFNRINEKLANAAQSILF